ncbi:hypothetical protein PN466_18655 [Roseofilum reptotaenium CS-1145]|uniref:Uncharacterized protein n=1 Tax=Roseofilum reptotaenium AO1-A TaxID=1925591 RepID=A0A1L9QTM9_9CYAN|nr:hypothetical protein [Roseofilum reptotaenium]MDB9518969.1 hypothetical protein [Roseofilum reptotaenium CS-1145]OJJ25976.1 hypothetical protein BI308_08425 [Roseofilum reptotaenium AO1-A]
MHQDYYFLFFKTADGDNPPVYSYQEHQSRNSFKLEYWSYTNFLIDYLKKEAAWRKKWKI